MMLIHAATTSDDRYCTAKTDITSMTHVTFSLLLLLYFDTSPSHPTPPQVPVSLLQPFKSLDLSALLNAAEHPSLAPENTKSSLNQVIWCFFCFSRVLFICFRIIHTHTYPIIGEVYLLGQNLHNTATQPSCTLARCLWK